METTKHNFYFAFGQKYAYEAHPSYPKANPNGWVRIVSESYEQARRKAVELFGLHFAMQYTDQNWKSTFFPKGEIECFEV